MNDLLQRKKQSTAKELITSMRIDTPDSAPKGAGKDINVILKW